MRHEERDRKTGRYATGPLCDHCGKPTGGDYCSDDEVCQGSDGPGFFLCDRKRCVATRDALTVSERRARYVRRES
jgi:hypothetical protein